MNTFKKFFPFIGALIVTLLIFTMSILIICNTKSLYYNDIDKLNISVSSDMPKNIIEKNFNTMVDYINGRTDSKDDLLTLPNFRISEAGLIHFKQTKSLVSLNKILLFLSASLCIFLIYIGVKKRDLSFMSYGGAASIALTTIILIASSFNFNMVFEVFHKILFPNDYWLFSPLEDPVITILPKEFFLHSITLTSIVIVSFGLFFIIISKWLKKDGYI